MSIVLGHRWEPLTTGISFLFFRDVEKGDSGRWKCSVHEKPRPLLAENSPWILISQPWLSYETNHRIVISAHPTILHSEGNPKIRTAGGLVSPNQVKKYIGYIAQPKLSFLGSNRWGSGVNGHYFQGGLPPVLMQVILATAFMISEAPSLSVLWVRKANDRESDAVEQFERLRKWTSWAFGDEFRQRGSLDQMSLSVVLLAWLFSSVSSNCSQGFLLIYQESD